MIRDDIIYLDYAATTPVDPRVADFMREVQRDFCANPSSNHRLGRQSQELVDTSASKVASLLGASSDAFVWTSGATESNNLAIRGTAAQRVHRGRHIITMRTEHKAVVDVFTALQADGYEVTWLAPDNDGYLDLDDLRAVLRKDTTLVSIMHVNNETGVVQDIAAIGSVCREHGVVYHVDAAQSVGKLPINLNALQIDLMSFTAHKFYGPKGIGGLYIADKLPLRPQMFGGSQQRRLRPGTLPVELIAATGEAAQLAAESMADDSAHLERMRGALLAGLSAVSGVRFNGDPERTHAGVLNVSCADVHGESLLLALEPLCVATGSACNSLSREPSTVLRAMGRSDAEAESAIRFSFGRWTTREEVSAAADQYCAAVLRLRSMNPPIVSAAAQ